MPPRSIVLLFVAIASGVVAGVVGSATAGHGSRPALTPPEVVFGMCPIPDEFRPAFVRAAGQSRLPLALLAAVASVESSFRADVHSTLQVLPSTAKALNADTSTPDRNVLAGARYLRLMIDRFGSTELALAAYNAGPTAVGAAGGAPDPASQAYVHEVTRLWRSFNGCK